MKEVVHADPLWKDRADYIIGARLQDNEGVEQLWARRVDDAHRFEICCIPFFLYDVALGDVVETDASYDVVSVIVPSGRFVFRVWFGDSFHPRHEIADDLRELGAQLEWSSENLLAVDAADLELADAVAAFLATEQAAGKLTYEAGRS